EMEGRSDVHFPIRVDPDLRIPTFYVLATERPDGFRLVSRHVALDSRPPPVDIDLIAHADGLVTFGPEPLALQLRSARGTTEGGRGSAARAVDDIPHGH